MVFLYEMKMLGKQVTELKTSLGYDNCFGVDIIGLSGRLALLRKEELDVPILSYSTHHIDCIVKLADEEVW